MNDDNQKPTPCDPCGETPLPDDPTTSTPAQPRHCDCFYVSNWSVEEFGQCHRSGGVARWQCYCPVCRDLARCWSIECRECIRENEAAPIFDNDGEPADGRGTATDQYHHRAPAGSVCRWHVDDPPCMGDMADEEERGQVEREKGTTKENAMSMLDGTTAAEEDRETRRLLAACGTPSAILDVLYPITEAELHADAEHVLTKGE